MNEPTQSRILSARQHEQVSEDLVKVLGYLNLAQNILKKGKFKSNLEIANKLDEILKQVRDDIRVHQEDAAFIARLDKAVQAKRDKIVEQAKFDMDKLSRIKDNYGNFAQFYYYVNDKPCYANFIVKKSKGIVLALLFPFDNNSYQAIATGSAKCVPDDCFNIHIGKAIALRRALGLKVPPEYFYIPQPSEVRVGDLVQDEHGKIAKVYNKERLQTNYPQIDIVTVENNPSKYEIVDDSRENLDGLEYII